MPAKKQYRPIITIFLVLGSLAGGILAQSGEAILDYYWQKASERYAQRRNVGEVVKYRISARSFYMTLDRKGRATKVDTALADYYYSGSDLDSSVFTRGDKGHFKYVELLPPDIYAHPYIIYSYPNDDGRGDLAIGLDVDSSDQKTTPSGMLLINRKSYLPHWLYLYYPTEGDLERFTRSFRLVEYNGLIVADSTWVVGSRRGVFFPEYFRIETGVTDIAVLP